MLNWLNPWKWWKIFQLNRRWQNLMKEASKLYEQGEIRSAILIFERALTIAREIFPAPNKDLAASLNNLAQLYISTDRYPAALELFTEAIEVQNRVLANYFAHTTPENQLILLESLHPNLEAFTSFVVKYQSGNPIAVATLFDAILQRKAASTIASTILNRIQYTNRYPHLRDSFDRWDLRSSLRP